VISKIYWKFSNNWIHNKASYK